MNKKEIKVIGIIPARMASTRFPGKPMADICGIPMIAHVYFRSKLSKMLDEVYIATCDKEIEDYSASIGAKGIMTKDTHERASDRAAEALSKIETRENRKMEIVVMIQCDEPLLAPEMIDMALNPILKDKNLQIVNLMGIIKNEREFDDPNTVKVVIDNNNMAMYFSREPIPSRKKFKGDFRSYKQIAIIPFRRDFLIKYNSLPPTPFEIVESVDMLRVLEHGYKIKMVLSEYNTFSVDTQQDKDFVSKIMEKDSVFKLYEDKV